MKPIIIFEGPDGAGKTTAAWHVARELGAVYVHHGAYHGLTGRDLAQLYHDTMLPAFDNAAPVVLDRCWMSEPIYGEVFRHGLDRLGPWRRMLDRVLLSCPHVVLRMSAPFEELWRVVAERSATELAQRREQLERVVAAYQHRGVGTVVDRTTTSPAAILEQARFVAPAFKPGSPAWQLRWLGAVGQVRWNHAGSVLLVGDRASAASTTDLPFVSYTLGGCSYWLAQQLERWGVPEERLCWVNATTPDGHDTDLGAIHGLNQWLGVVALGNEAGDALTRCGITHVRVRHPQHVKRFDYDRADQTWDLRHVLTDALNIKENP